MLVFAALRMFMSELLIMCVLPSLLRSMSDDACTATRLAAVNEIEEEYALSVSDDALSNIVP